MTAYKVSVIIPCHNYGRFLPDCLQSILGQTRVPDEVIVVDDASDKDDIEAVTLQFKSPLLQYIRVNFRDVNLARWAGFEKSSGNFVLCIDADDVIDPFYIESGLRHFEQDYRVAVVYSDVEFFGNETGKSNYPSGVTVSELATNNCIHAGALVRRDAIEVSDAFNHGGPRNRHEDWSTWRKILEMGYRAEKQSSLYRYRKHEKQHSSNRHYGQNNYLYYDGAALSEEVITLFTPLAGRLELWEPFKNFLENQTWDHNRIRLILMDTSQNADFGKAVRKWLMESDYKDVHYLTAKVGSQGLADEKRTDDSGKGRPDVLADVRIAMARIYNAMSKLITTNYTWIVEDDVIPPLDACERLLRSFCPNTMSVSGAFEHRYENAVVAWDSSGHCLSDGSGVQEIKGNGFGCVMLRSLCIQNHVFSFRQDHPDFDKAFYEFIPENTLVKIDWSIRCAHLSPSYRDRPSKRKEKETDILTADNFDELFYLQEYSDIHEALATGVYHSAWEHYNLIGRKQGRRAKSMFPSKSLLESPTARSVSVSARQKLEPLE